jgi:hypothetical protein
VTRAPSLSQRPDVRAGDAAEEDVAEMTTWRPAISLRPSFSRMVKVSSSAWVGCSCAPSPALMTLAFEPLGEELRRAGGAVAQDDDVGIQRLEVGAVSLSVSPFLRGSRLGGDIDDVGAEALKAASSKLMRVRVEGSTKKLTTVLPRRAGTFLMMAAVHQHGELDFFGPAEIVDGVHRRAGGAAAEEHVIHQHHGFAGDIEGDDGRVHVGAEAAGPGRRGAW